MNRCKNIKDYIITFTYSNKRKRKLDKFRHELDVIGRMDEVEIRYEHMSLKSEYEHKKRIFTAFMIITFINAVCCILWFSKITLKYAASIDNEACKTVSLYITVIVCIAIMAIVISSLVIILNEMKDTHMRLIIIEDAMNCMCSIQRNKESGDIK